MDFGVPFKQISYQNIEILFDTGGLNHKVKLTLRWCRARDLSGSQIPVTTVRFELRISYIRSSYLTHWATIYV